VPYLNFAAKGLMEVALQHSRQMRTNFG